MYSEKETCGSNFFLCLLAVILNSSKIIRDWIELRAISGIGIESGLLDGSDIDEVSIFGLKDED